MEKDNLPIAVGALEDILATARKVNVHVDPAIILANALFKVEAIANTALKEMEKS